MQFWAGWQFYKGAWQAGRHGSANMSTLVALGQRAERKADGEDADRTYAIAETTLNDPWGGAVVVAYAVPVQ